MRPSSPRRNERSRRTVTATTAGGAPLGRGTTDRGDHTAAATESFPSGALPPSFGGHFAVVVTVASTIPLLLPTSPTLGFRRDHIGVVMVVMVMMRQLLW